MTVLEAIQRSTEFLARKAVESPRLNSEHLVGHVTAMPRMQLYLNFERPLTEPETARLRELVRRRGLREPLQQILGTAVFCGLEIAVSRHVLVPRPETELLAEAGWNFLGEVAAAVPGEETLALDWGTGSGCIAVAMAANCPGCRVTAVDNSPEALELARVNAERNAVSARIEFAVSPPAGASYHLLVSNPPYIPSAEIASLPPEVRDFEPHQALDGGADGLAYYRQLAAEAREWLRPGGRIMLEFGDGQAEAVAAVFSAQKWVVEAVREDYTHRPRILIARHNW